MFTLLQKCSGLRFSTNAFLFFFVLLQSCRAIEENLPEAAIISFQFSGISTQKSSISTDAKSVEITVPYGSSIKSLTPVIDITAGANIVPASKIPQNFSQPIYYVLTSAEGKKTVYKVSVISLKQPPVEINGFNKTELEAGENMVVKGKYFGNFQGAVQAYLVNDRGEEFLVSSRLLDSTQVKLDIPTTVFPQDYAVKIRVNESVVTSIAKITVQYPKPEIISLSKKNILQEDTLFVKGDFLVDTYRYKLQLSEGKNQVFSTVQKTSKGEYYVILGKSISAGNYAVQILNETTQKTSKSQDFNIKLYDLNKPFVQGIIRSKPAYNSGDNIIFKTLNFERFPTRFFQIQLSNGKEVLFQNGIYNEPSNTLTLDLPLFLKSGIFGITITLINASNQEFVIELDETLIVQ